MWQWLEKLLSPTQDDFRRFLRHNSELNVQSEKDEAIDVLREALAGMTKAEEYNGYWIAHLLGQTSKEQFEVDVAQLVEKDPVEIPFMNLLRKVDLLFKYGPERTYTSSDISSLFNVDEKRVDAVLWYRENQGVQD